MSVQVLQLLEFGPFRIDTARRLLYRGGTVVEIPPKAFAVLLALVERRGQIVDKQELMDAVWPNTAVEENNLARSISTLRKTLGERSGEHRYIVTVPGRGYSFVAGENAAETVNGSHSDNRPGSRFPRKPSAQGVTALGACSIAVLLWISGQAARPPVDRFEPASVVSNK